MIPNDSKVNPCCIGSFSISNTLKDRISLYSANFVCASEKKDAEMSVNTNSTWRSLPNSCFK